MKFLPSFLRRHLAGKPLVASPNVGCFPSLPPLYKALQRLLFFVMADKNLSTWSLSSVPKVTVTLMALKKCKKECNEAQFLMDSFFKMFANRPLYEMKD